MSQEEHEANLKNDLKNLNFDESSLSNIFKDDPSSCCKSNYEINESKVIR